ncbi:MAG TPA: AAA family ATPase [Steroidobacteraceae bacterium]|nr:AAA family ATPase [Steroidobacteraceae bacterium]
MLHDPWFPIGHALPGGGACGRYLFGGAGWQILETSEHGRVLIADEGLAARWIGSALVNESTLPAVDFGAKRYRALCCDPCHVLSPVGESPSPKSRSEALAFALSLKATRAIDGETPLQDAIYVEKISRLLPTYGITARAGDDVVLGRWLTGGASLSAMSLRRLQQILTWLSPEEIEDIVRTAGISASPTDQIVAERRGEAHQESDASTGGKLTGAVPGRSFELPGRPELAEFINEHVVDIIQNKERYMALGVDFPGAIVLHGPPGCGKTFAVEQLIEFLGWPSYTVDASSVASPYIHDTSRKVAALFDEAMKNSPAVLIIDEMEAFVADRDTASGHHRVEEVAEFLRRIPEAVKNEVLIIAMTNRIDLIDPAILRRGRFDHIINVGYASEIEIRSLLAVLLDSLPKDADVDPTPLAVALAGRPLSDVAFVVREGARRAGRAGRDRLSQADLLSALAGTPSRDPDAGRRNRIGFV